MNKQQAAAALREAADLIEAMEYDGEDIDAEVSFHFVTRRDVLTGIIASASGVEINPRSIGTTHWANWTSDGGCDFTVFFEPHCLGEVVRTKEIVHETVTENISDLLQSTERTTTARG